MTNDMKIGKLLLRAALALGLIAINIELSAGNAGEIQSSVREIVAADRIKASGLDAVYDFDAVSPAACPKGYKPFYISHYGRHGSRYAYARETYTDLLEMLQKAEREDNITEYGKSLSLRLADFYEKVRYRVGDLTDKGWNQQKRMAGKMHSDYPGAFGKGSNVRACASGSIRSIMSMTSFCTELSRIAPKTEIIAHQGLEYIQATSPNLGTNPFRFKGPKFDFPYAESDEEFLRSFFPEYIEVLGRMFKDPSKAIEGKSHLWTMDYMYMLVGGMNSLDDDVRNDFSDIFTSKEYVKMWEVDNYLRFCEYYWYRTSCSAIFVDMLDKAEKVIASGGSGADLRFGHDHCLMTLLMIADLDHFGHFPETPEELSQYYQTYRSPMAGNLQFIFYRSRRKGAEPLVRVLLNGQDAALGDLAHSESIYYAWSDLRDYLRSRIAMFL